MDTEGSRQAQPEPSSSASLVDTASTLRAAALLSRKRRKVATETLSRRAPEPSLRLDYGHEGSMSPSGHVSPAGTRHISHPQSGPSISASTTKKTPDTEDGQREEGEISDTETSPTPAPPPQQRTRTPTPPARISPRASTTQPLQHYHRQGATKTETLPPSQTPSLRDSDTVSPSEPGPSWRDGNYLPNEPFVLETPTYRLDPHHVRPGLTMTQQEYDTAKDVVLDLLGWGVPPEYLVEHGISRYIIYYVFTELNLRLPDNLDVSDLVPYPTPEMLEKLTISPSPTTWSFRSSSASAMPPPPVIPIRDSLADVADRADILMSSSPSRSPTVKAEPSSPSPTDLSLHAIEQQRRQELLARKAAIASQRARQSDREVTIQPGGTLGLAAVPSHSNKGDRKSVNPSREMKSDESMDVDEPVLGPISVTEDDSRLSTSPQTVPSKMTDPTAQTEPNLPAVVPPGSSSDALRSTASRHGLSSLTLSADAVGDPPTLRQQLSADDSDGTNSHRRGSKRPVAADFVDFDTSLARNQGGSYSSNGYANGGSQLIRRKTGSFASINMRRCVIELSDSEDDGDGRLLAPTPNANGREYSPAVVAVPTHYSSRLRTTTTPPIPASSGGAQSTGLTAPPPSALLEKEEEIKKMRQLIAEREEMRLRKLAVMSGKSTLVVQPANASVRRDPSKPDDASSTSRRLDPESQPLISNATTSRGTSDIVVTVESVKSDPTASETSTIGHETCARDDDDDDDQDVGEAAERAQAVSNWRVESQRAPAAGDSGVSSSAQVVEYDASEACNAFTFYDSPLVAYPLLRSRLEPANGDTGHSAMEAPLASSVSFPFRGALSRTAHASIPMMLPDLKQMKQAILLRTLTEMTAGDAGIRVCPYEVPGGGTCRNDECEELHLSRISCEPSDAEVAAYVHSRLLSPWRGRCDARAIAIALERVRLRGGAGDLEADVMTALSELGMPATPASDDDDDNLSRMSITAGKSAQRHRRAM